MVSIAHYLSGWRHSLSRGSANIFTIRFHGFLASRYAARDLGLVLSFKRTVAASEKVQSSAPQDASG